MVNRQSELLNAFQTTLATEMSSAASTMELDDATGLTEPFYMVIEPENEAQREYVYVSSLTGTTATVPERYLTGSAAGSGLTHPVGSVVRMVVMAQHVEETSTTA